MPVSLQRAIQPRPMPPARFAAAPCLCFPALLLGAIAAAPPAAAAPPSGTAVLISPAAPHGPGLWNDDRMGSARERHKDILPGGRG
jgi:hypothetical protein